MKASINTRNQFGLIDLTENGRKQAALKFHNNIAKPWKGMHYYFDYGVWAINEENAKRKSVK